MCGTFSWFWICASRLYMHGGNRVMLTFPTASLPPPQVHRELPGHVDREIVRLQLETSLRGDRLPQGEPPDQIRVLQGGDEDSGHRVREQLGELVRRRDRDSIRRGPAFERLEDPRLSEVPGPGVRGFQEDLFEADLLRPDEGGRFA